jgi:hypothetical protein
MGESCRRMHSPLFARYDVCTGPSAGGVSVGRVGVYRRYPRYPYGRIMPANSFAAIRPIRRVQRSLGRGRVRRSGRGISSIPTVPVGANHAGECIRRYSPDTTCAPVRRPGACPSVRSGYIVDTHGTRMGESCRRMHSPLFARYDVCTGPSAGGVSVGRVGVYRRYPRYPYGRIMPANAFAAIRPIRRVQRSLGRGRVRRSGRGISSIPTVPVGANHAGECIRRYSPDTTCAPVRRPGACPSVGSGYIVDTHGTRRGESCRRIHSPLFARYDACTGPSVGGVSVGRVRVYRRYPRYPYGRIMPANAFAAIRPIRRVHRSVGRGRVRRSGRGISSIPTVPVGANHAGECIRRYSPNVCNGPSAGGVSVGRVGVYRRYPRYPYGRIMPANAFAAIRPIRRVHRSLGRGRVRRSGACPAAGGVGRGHSPLFARSYISLVYNNGIIQQVVALM